MDDLARAATGPGPAGPLAELRAEGFTVLRSVFGPDVGGALDAAVRALAEAEDPSGRGPFEDPSSLRVLNLLAKHDAFAALPVQPEVLSLVTGLLGPGCLVSSVASLYLAPGQQAQPLHSDDQAIHVHRDPAYPLVCTAIWALGPCTEENGVTRLVRGSHRSPDRRAWSTRRRTPDEDVVSVALDPGDVLVYDGSMHHGAGANTTSAYRRAIGVGYCAGFLRQAENQMLGIPRERVARFDPQLQELCGYAIYDGILGHVDRRAPQELLGDG